MDTLVIPKFSLPLRTKKRLHLHALLVLMPPFGLCNASITFQMCMIFIFFDLVEQCLKIFKDYFSVYVESFEDCLTNLRKSLRRCRDKHVTIN